jgi:hypothetical protein
MAYRSNGRLFGCSTKLFYVIALFGRKPATTFFGANIAYEIWKIKENEI